MAERPQAEHLTPVQRSEQLRRIRAINRGGAIIATAGVVGLGALAAVSFPGTSTTDAGANTTTSGVATPAATTAPTTDTGSGTAGTSSGTSAATAAPAATPSPTPTPIATPAATARTTTRGGRSTSGGS